MITDRYMQHEMSERAADVSNAIRDKASDLDSLLSGFVPDCREKSIAITKLEECVMWANKALAMMCR